MCSGAWIEGPACRHCWPSALSWQHGRSLQRSVTGQQAEDSGAVALLTPPQAWAAMPRTGRQCAIASAAVRDAYSLQLAAHPCIRAPSELHASCLICSDRRLLSHVAVARKVIWATATAGGRNCAAACRGFNGRSNEPFKAINTGSGSTPSFLCRASVSLTTQRLLSGQLHRRFFRILLEQSQHRQALSTLVDISRQNSTAICQQDPSFNGKKRAGFSIVNHGKATPCYGYADGGPTPQPASTSAILSSGSLQCGCVADRSRWQYSSCPA